LAVVPDLKRWTLHDCVRVAPDALPLLDELIRQNVLVQSGLTVAFRHRAFSEALLASQSDAGLHELHLRLVAMHEAGSGHPLTVAYHLHHAQRAQACLRSVRTWLARDGYERLRPHWANVLDAIATDATRYPVRPLERHRLRTVLVQHAAVLAPEYAHHAEQSFARLHHDTGLVYWHEHPDLEPLARIGRCLERAVAAHQATPEPERGLAPFDAVRELALLVRGMASVYARTLAAKQLLGLAAWLEPFRPLAPVIEVLYEVTQTSVARAVHDKRVAHRFIALAARFEQPIAGIDDAVRSHATGIFLYAAAMDEAKQGKTTALARVEPLDRLENFPALAWHVRMLSHIYNGRTEEAARCRERMELLVIAQDEPIALLAMSVLFEAWGYELCEDLTGLKAALEQVEDEAKRYPGWQPWATLYRGDVNRLRGDMPAAFVCYEQAAAMTEPRKHNAWPHAAERRVGALRALGRCAEAIALGRELAQFAEDEDLEPTNLLRCYIALALSEAQAGQLTAAHGNIAKALRCAEREGIGGVPLGIVHEAAARVAMHQRDATAFEQARAACASYLLSGDNPSLTAKYERLLRDAQAVGLVQARLSRDTAQPLAPVLERLRAARDASERAAVLLGFAAEKYHVAAGCLFGVTDHSVTLLAQCGRIVVDDQLRSLVAAFLTAELSESEMVTVTQQDERAALGPSNAWTIDENHTYVPVLLRGHKASDRLIVGVAVLRFDALLFAPPDQRLVDALGQALLDSGDIQGRSEAV
jgi:tetratricopeptide (TPR) repeat protein